MSYYVDNFNTALALKPYLIEYLIHNAFFLFLTLCSGKVWILALGLRVMTLVFYYKFPFQLKTRRRISFQLTELSETDVFRVQLLGSFTFGARCTRWKNANHIWPGRGWNQGRLREKQTLHCVGTKAGLYCEEEQVCHIHITTRHSVVVQCSNYLNKYTFEERNCLFKYKLAVRRSVMGSPYTYWNQKGSDIVYITGQYCYFKIYFEMFYTLTYFGRLHDRHRSPDT